MDKTKQRTGRSKMPVIVALIVGLAGGLLISNYTILGENLDLFSKKKVQQEKEILYWVAPMDPDYRRDGPGKSPMGMDLVPVYADEPAKTQEPEILYWVAPMDPDYRRDGPGKSPMGMDLVPVYADEPAKTEEPEILYWVAPMDPDYRRDEPGKSPMGMDLVPVYAEPEADKDAIHISPTVEQNLGVRTATAQRRALWRKIEATGYVGFDETRASQISLRTEGWIEHLLVENEGERVSKGQLLFEIYSPQLVNAQMDYVQAKRKDGSSVVNAAEKKLLALGMEPAQIQQLSQTLEVKNRVQVLAPQDGIVTHLNVREGMFVKPATEIMSLTDLSSVWLQAGVFESQADWVMESQSAEARLNYMPGEVFSGRVDYVYPVLDAKTRTLQVRLQFDNPDERMKPNMFGKVTIFGKSHPAALSIPREALIRGQDNDRVVIALGDGKFTVNEVMSGIESGDWVEIIAGLEEGDTVVTSAQFLIDSEASMAGSINRLNSISAAGTQDTQAPVFGVGIVKAVDLATRKIRVSHGPIEALGWTPMTMEFDVLPGADLTMVNVGQSIHFSLKHTEVGDYVIDVIHQPEPAGVEDTPARPDAHDHHHMESSS